MQRPLIRPFPLRSHAIINMIRVAKSIIICHCCGLWCILWFRFPSPKLTWERAQSFVLSKDDSVKVEVGHYYNEKRVLISTEKILTLFFLLVTFLFISLSLSLIFHVRYSSENRSGIRKNSVFLWFSDSCWDLCCSFVKICTEEREQNSNNCI